MKTITNMRNLLRIKINFPLILATLLSISYLTIAQDLKDEFKPSGKVWGLTFGDFWWKTGGDDFKYHADSTPFRAAFGDAEFAKRFPNESGISFRRLYLGYDYNIAPNFIAKILLEGGDGIVTPGGDRTVLIKSANVEWKNIIKRHSLYIGQVGTTSFSLCESTWGLRSVEKVLGDARKWLPSNDLGFRWSGTIDSSGNFGYHFQYGTGKGTKPEDNYYRKYYLGVDAKLMDKKILIALNYDMENIYKHDKEYVPNFAKSADQGKSSISGFVALQLEKFTIGIDYVTQTLTHSDKKTDTVNTTTNKVDSLDIKPFGLSFFVKATLIKDKLLLFGRYDMINPDADYKNTQTYKNLKYDAYNETFMTFGFDWMPNKNVHIIPNLWMNSYTDNRKKPDGYDKAKIGDAKKYWERKTDLVPRITFFYVFK